MPDYSKGCIYKIKHKDDFDDENIYIGSTCNLIRRRNRHKNLCNDFNLKDYNRNIYKYIRDNGGWEQFIVLKICDFPCNSKSELNIEERRYLDLMKPKLNMIRSYVYKEEAYERDKEKNKKYRENNKEKISEKKKEWYENNKEQLAEKITCECGSEVRKNKIQRHRKTIKHQELIKKN